MIKISTIFTFILIFILFCILPLILINFCKNKKVNKIYSIIGIIIYIILILLFTIPARNFSFKEIILQFNPDSNWFNKIINLQFWKHSVSDALINILMFIPLGILFFQYEKNENKKNTIIKSFIFGFCFSLCIEILQFILPFKHYPDLSDLILNTLSLGIGTFISFIIYKIINKIKLKK